MAGPCSPSSSPLHPFLILLILIPSSFLLRPFLIPLSLSLFLFLLVRPFARRKDRGGGSGARHPSPVAVRGAAAAAPAGGASDLFHFLVRHFARREDRGGGSGARRPSPVAIRGAAAEVEMRVRSAEPRRCHGLSQVPGPPS